MFYIFLSVQSKKREVVAFLKELKDLLGQDDFDINTDMILIRKKKQGKDQIYSTPYTMLDLDYDIDDVIARLKELKLEEYSETKIDRDDVNPPLLFVFGKDICEVKNKGRSEKAYFMCIVSLCEGAYDISLCINAE